MDFASANATVAAADELDVPTMEILVRVEATGEAFYDLLAERIGNPEAAELLRRNGREEMGHARRIQRAIALKAGDGYVAPADLTEPLPVSLPETVDLAILPFIVSGELEGDSGYQAWADKEDDPEVARLLRLNGREETKHAQRLEQVIAILEAAEPA